MVVLPAGSAEFRTSTVCGRGARSVRGNVGAPPELKRRGVHRSGGRSTTPKNIGAPPEEAQGQHGGILESRSGPRIYEFRWPALV